jgi:diguanylate cyclase (GGDEF)-like protein
LPSNAEKETVVHQDIQSRSGNLHGQIFVSLQESVGRAAKALDALSIGAWLCTLAIDTRGMYTDLIHRSEFDLLTEVRNRFSFDRHLDALIEDSQKNTLSFGLIYIDLDRFKQVNDQYGHLVGDLYLQEVAMRMKRQLRPDDMLARLGGDEFGVLVPNILDRARVEEIALRLERCFDETFFFDGYRLDGGASVGIAVFPDDATTRDSLLSAGDAAMYLTKHAKRAM